MDGTSVQRKPISVRRLKPFDVRIPDWSESDLIQRSCPVCASTGSFEPFVSRPDNLTVVSCASCGIHFVDPCPGSEALARFYSAYGSTHWKLTYTTGQAQRMRQEASNTQAHWMEDPKIVGIMRTGGFAGKKTLDVGCSNGIFLVRAQSLGASPVGLDMDAEALRFLRNELGIPTMWGNVEKLEFDEGGYDLITCWDLVEHLLDPSATVKKLVRSLKPSGRIAFWTPNADLIQRWYEDWIGFRVDLEHLQYFGVKTLGSLLGRSGARLIHVEALGFPSLRWLAPSESEAKNPPPGGPPSKLRGQLKRCTPLVKAVQLARRLEGGRWTAPVEALERKYEGYHLLAIAEKN